MNKYKTLIILDWDDTLFPTTWLLKNNIDLNIKDNVYKYIVFFSKLDTILFQLINKLLKYGNVVIVTNAAKKWIDLTLNLLPNTQKLINNKIIVISARELCQESYPTEIYLWKKIIFNKLTHNYFSNIKLQNIISVGDADYEFNALIDLYDKQSFIKNKLLKTIRFAKEPSFDSLTDQLEILYSCIDNVITSNNHCDLQFINNK